MAGLTDRQYDRKFQELLHRIRKKTTLFSDDTIEKQALRKEQALNDFFFFKQTYFPHYCTKPSGEFHQDLHALSELSQMIVAVAGPRKHGKTVDLGVMKPLWKSLKGDIHFFIVIGDNELLAAERTLAIKFEFLYNERLKHDFGEQLNEFVADDEFIIRDGVKFKAMGWRQPLQGKIFGSYRPDYIFIDDFENDKSHNPRIAREKLSFVRGEAFGALPDTGGIVLWVGNRTQKHSALNYFKQIVEESDVEELIYREYKAIKEDGTPLWPEAFTIAQLEKLRETMGYAEFEKHMQQNPIIDGVIFKGTWFRYFNKTGYKPTGKLICLCDPSLGQKRSDFQAVAVLEQIKSVHYRLLHMWLRKESIDNMIRQLYWVDQNFETEIWLETNLWQSLLLHFIPGIAQEMGYLLPVFSYSVMTNKQEDIMKLQPLYERGHVEHYSPKDEDLFEYEEQLCFFDPEMSRSNTIKDDGPDVVARAMKRFKIAAGGLTGVIGNPLIASTFRKMP